MINDPNYPQAPNYPQGDADHDDLPRTLRRERDAREREKREREMREHQTAGPALTSATAQASFGVPESAAFQAPIEVEAPAARVTAFDVPFGHLVVFFLKAALAAIPALLLLGAFLWVVGHLAQTFFPQLVKMQILIWFPNNT